MIETKEIMSREAVTGGIFECRYDESLTLTQADNSLFRLLGMNAGSLTSGTPISFLDRICAEDRPIFLEKIRYQLSRSRVFMSELHIMTSNGQLRWIHICGELLTEQESPLLHCIFHDVTDARDRQERLAIESQIYDIILSQTQDIIFELDCLTRDIYYSPTFEKKFGYQIPVRGFPDSMFATDIIHEKDKIPLRSCFQSILAGQDQMQCEYRLKHRNGRYLWVSVNATAIRDLRGRLLKIVGIISDINEQKEEILRAKKDALLDPLTSLLNRRECIRRIEAYTRTEEEMGALILIDIDNFKSINDTNGHLFGDKVLVDLAAALRLAFRRNDITARIEEMNSLHSCLTYMSMGMWCQSLKPFSIPCPGAQRRAGRKKRHRSRTTRLPSASGSAFILTMERIFPPSLKRQTQPCTTQNEEVKTNITYIRKMHPRHTTPDAYGKEDNAGVPIKGLIPGFVPMPGISPSPFLLHSLAGY